MVGEQAPVSAIYTEHRVNPNPTAVSALLHLCSASVKTTVGFLLLPAGETSHWRLSKHKSWLGYTGFFSVSSALFQAGVEFTRAVRGSGASIWRYQPHTSVQYMLTWNVFKVVAAAYQIKCCGSVTLLVNHPTQYLETQFVSLNIIKWGASLTPRARH